MQLRPVFFVPRGLFEIYVPFGKESEYRHTIQQKEQQIRQLEREKQQQEQQIQQLAQRIRKQEQ